VQIALRTQQVIAYENGVGDVADPLGGSYYVESVTNRLEAEASDYIDTIDNLGGAMAAIEKGFQQREIQESAYRYQLEVEKKERVIVGVNEFVANGDEANDILRLDPSIGQRQAEKLRKLRANRDDAKVAHVRGRIADAARGTENLMPLIVEAVEDRVTLGEISHTLREVWGEYRPQVVI
jgi:methylmalonyl-CoA mutase N-terminal domain/subunit